MTLITLCTASLAHGFVKDLIDNKIYDSIEDRFKEKYSPEMVKCLMNGMKREKIVDRFYTTDVFFNQVLLTLLK